MISKKELRRFYVALIAALRRYHEAVVAYKEDATDATLDECVRASISLTLAQKTYDAAVRDYLNNLPRGTLQ